MNQFLKFWLNVQYLFVPFCYSFPEIMDNNLNFRIDLIQRTLQLIKLQLLSDTAMGVSYLVPVQKVLSEAVLRHSFDFHLNSLVFLS